MKITNSCTNIPDFGIEDMKMGEGYIVAQDHEKTGWSKGDFVTRGGDVVVNLSDESYDVKSTLETFKVRHFKTGESVTITGD